MRCIAIQDFERELTVVITLLMDFLRFLRKGAVPLFLWTLWEDWESFELDSIRIWKFFYSVDDIRSANLIYYYENKLIFNLKKTGIRALEVLLYG